MNLAFCLFKYFPYGGLQRDCLRIAHACKARGHQVVILTSQWQGDKPAEFNIEVLPVSGIGNHVRNRNFVAARDAYLKQHPCDGVIGFDKMPGLDLYYAADTCFAEKGLTQRHWLYRLTPRFRTAMAFEKAVFSLETKTHILSISDAQMAVFKQYYQTPASRIHSLPPGIARDRCAGANSAEIRKEVREEFGLSDEQWMLLSVGSDYKRKGVDRTLKLIANLPKEMRQKVKFWVIGQDNAAPFEKLARQLRIADNVHFVQGRNDISRVLQAADLFLHPAYSENTGTVLLEALVAGLPEIVTDVCGYAHYISEANCGAVLESPFNESTYLTALVEALYDSQLRARWRQNALRFAAQADLYSMPERAAEIIDTVLLARL